MGDAKRIDAILHRCAGESSEDAAYRVVAERDTAFHNLTVDRNWDEMREMLSNTQVLHAENTALRAKLTAIRALCRQNRSGAKTVPVWQVEKILGGGDE